MSSEGGGDSARQAANAAGAVFQVLAGPGLAALGLADASGGAPVRPMIQPADWAFAIWGPIFILSLGYAVYQALPANRENPLLRRVGWFSAGAFFFNGIFEVLTFALRQFVPAQAVMVGIFLCAGAAYLRLARSGRGALEGAERWLVALPLGLLFGWITAAAVVTAAGALVYAGLPAGGVAEALSGASLLLLGGLLAAGVVLSGEHAPPQGYLAYAAAVLWALVGVVAAQYDASLVTAAAALVAAVPVALGLLRRTR